MALTVSGCQVGEQAVRLCGGSGEVVSATGLIHRFQGSVVLGGCAVLSGWGGGGREDRFARGQWAGAAVRVDLKPEALVGAGVVDGGCDRPSRSCGVESELLQDDACRVGAGRDVDGLGVDECGAVRGDAHLGVGHVVPPGMGRVLVPPADGKAGAAQPR